MYCLGIDTSCYTTSLAAVNESFELCYDGRIMLDVPEGGRGLRQSEAFFQHINNISLLMEQCMKIIDTDAIKGISVSTRPRSAENSYMPVFMAGFHMAKIISSLLKLPIFEVTHQDSHLEAGVWSSKHEPDPEFIAYHISGGTTELLHVQKKDTMEIIKIGGSSDLNAGQFIDRVGVAMGLKFPCGQEMDKLCSEYETKGIDVPISIDGCFASFSGPETHVQRLIKDKALGAYEMAGISMGVFLCIAKSIERTVLNAKKKYDIGKLLLVGGVASNAWIRNYLKNSDRLKESGIAPVFSNERYSSDNAAGTAVLGMKKFNERLNK
ncbi:MAG: O-sialoglycoprotein endopeptidase [Clostridiaceae bacterium]|nr:O-sialoglycoprotein endopeptidase [Clostridiaceae bacterium]